MDELSHHGVLGMKWGVRRYQPYPNGYSGDGKYIGPKTGQQITDKDTRKINRANREIDARVKESVKSGNKKALKSLKGTISKSDYKDIYKDLVSKGIKDAIDSGNVKKLKQFKSDLSKTDYKYAKDKALFNSAINNLKGKKMAKYAARLSDDDIRNANARIQNLTNINRSIKSIKQDNSAFFASADIAKKLGVMIGVTVAAKGAVDKFKPKG
jgi:hypothetical protein